MARRKEPSIPDALLDQLLPGMEAKAAFDPGGLLDGLKKALVERALNAEIEHHLGAVIVRCILAASSLKGGKNAAKAVMAAVAANRGRIRVRPSLQWPEP